MTENDHLRGLLTLTDVTKVPKESWAETAVGEVAVPWERMVRVEPGVPLLSALQVMDDANVNQVPVVMGDRLVGMLTREQVLHYIRVRAELGV
ncbi:MAG: CBS domain-containing protein [Synergistales bacterium]|nr:CBS domain-containing protein [Synergistales bacterium]